MTFVDDRVGVLSDQEDADDQEVEDDGHDHEDPGHDPPGFPALGIVLGLLFLKHDNFSVMGGIVDSSM